MATERSEVRLEFNGSVLQALDWIVASILGGLLAGIPLAWVNAGLARWICRNTTFSDGPSGLGTTAEFRGTGGEVVVWHVLLFLVIGGQQFALARTDPGDYASQFVSFTLAYLFMIGIILMLLKWFVYNLRLIPGPPLAFTGSFIGLLGWYVAIAGSILTVIGWAWVAVEMYRWIARNIKGDGIAIEFRATGLEFLWRVVVTALGSLLIVTIPFLTVWFGRWMMSNVVLIRGVETEWGDFINEQRTPQKPSWPAVPPLHRTID